MRGNDRSLVGLKVALWVVGLAPTVWIGWAALNGGLGANPIEKALHVAGRWALVFLIGTLAVTPLRRMTGWNPIIRTRRLVGLFAFYYAVLHFSVYAGLDQFFALEYILEDVVERPYITVGFVALVLLVPLAITSTRGWIRRLGKRWQKLHRLVYVAAALGVVHFYWKTKADTLWPVVAAVALSALLAARVLTGRSRRARPGVKSPARS
jgi:sulfoxide reductase heme-binding subunit YedZ